MRSSGDSKGGEPGREGNAMIKVNEIIAWSAAERSDYIELGIDQLNASVRSLRRSVDFYTRVFGFCSHDFDRDRGSVVMKATARVDLVLHEQRGERELPGPLRRWGFVVGNLDRARQAVWDLGVRCRARQRRARSYLSMVESPFAVRPRSRRERDRARARFGATRVSYGSAEHQHRALGASRHDLGRELAAVGVTPDEPVVTATYCLPSTA